jgi:GntP family gluconate:H+ symporter
MPLVFMMSQKTSMPLLQIGIPLVSGLSVMHGLVPPHPGPMVAIEILKGDVGKTILYSVLVGIPTAIIAEPLLGNFLARRVPLQASGELMAQFTGTRREGEAEASESTGTSASSRRRLHSPGFAITVFTILLPVLLILLATVVDLAFPRGDAFRQGGYSVGYKCGFDRRQILAFTNECLAPIGGIILVIGAGGGFKEVLVGSGVGAAIAERASHWHLSPLLFGWLVAALIRIATGSATVAITTAVGIVLPVASGVPGVNLELVVVAMGAGSLKLSQVNDGGFWLVKEYFNM